MSTAFKKVIHDIIDAVDGAGREFKTGFGGAFRKRGGKHRADADAIRGWDRRNSSRTPRHRADAPTSHAREYDIRREAAGVWKAADYAPRHAAEGVHPMRDLGTSVAKQIQALPGEVMGEVKGLHKKTARQLVEELWEDAIGQRSPDEYGVRDETPTRFLAPASERGALDDMSPAEIAERFGVEAASVQAGTIEVAPVAGGRFVSVQITTDDGAR